VLWVHKDLLDQEDHKVFKVQTLKPELKDLQAQEVYKVLQVMRVKLALRALKDQPVLLD
jgi:hypothetical protein